MNQKQRTFLLGFVLLLGMVLPSFTQGVAFIYKAESKVGSSRASSVDVCYEGFVPCGKEVWINGKITDGHCTSSRSEVVDCQFCHFFVMINNIVFYILKNIVPLLALLMLAIGGVMFYFGGANPNLLAKAKRLIQGVVIGLFLIYGAYMIVGTFLTVVGVSQVSALGKWTSEGAFAITCPISR